MSDTINASMSSGYTIETVKTTIKMLDEARYHVKTHPEHYDVEKAIADLDARIKKWGLKLTELTVAEKS